MNPETRPNQSMLAFALLAGATLPSLAGCSKGGSGIVVEPVPQVTLARSADLPGPFAPEQIQVLIGGSPTQGTIEIYEPGQSTTGAPSMAYTPGTSVLFSLPGTYTAKVGLASGAVQDVPFTVSLDFNAFLGLEPGSAVMGTGPVSLSLRNAAQGLIPNWELRAFRFDPQTLQFQPLNFLSAQGNVEALQTTNGLLPFSLSQLGTTASDTVIYVQGRETGAGNRSSCVFSPLFIPYQGMPQLPALGVDIGVGGFAPRQGGSFDLRLHGVDMGAAVRMRPISLAQNLVDLVISGGSATQTVSVAVPTINVPIPTLWYLEIVVSRSDGTRTYEAVVPVLP